MSIYVSIGSLEDRDIRTTVISALENAHDPSSIHIGIAAFVGDEFYNEILAPLTKYDQVSIKVFDIKTNKGLGKGRRLSRFAYNNEDYILQVDSHTYFDRDWDKFLIDNYLDAQKELGNEKIVFSSYLPPCSFDDDGVLFFESFTKYARYNVFLQTDNRDLLGIARWTELPLSEFPDELKTGVENDKFVPANKTSGCFIFGDKHFAEFSGLPENVMFWEEDVIQSIELLSNGFYLTFLNKELPLFHRYSNTEGTDRPGVSDVYGWNNLILMSMMTSIFHEYVDSNEEKCKRYRDYSKYDVVINRVRPYYVPTTYEF